MASHPNQSYGNTGNYSNPRRRSFEPSPGSQQRLAELPALDGNVNQGIPHPYSLAHRSPTSIGESANYFPTGSSDPGHYGTHQYTQGQGAGYRQHGQGAIPIPYPPGQTAHNIYNQQGVNPQGSHGPQLYPGGDFSRSASWPPHHTGHSAPPLIPYESASMSQLQGPGNNWGRRQVLVPQRSYVPHHRQNYFDQFIPEGPIVFPQRSGGDGIALSDAMNENFDNLIGRDEAMFASYAGPAISLRLEWPGYKSWTKQIKTKDWRREPKPITKSKLAFEVAKKVRDFMQENINEPMIPGNESWKVGPGFIEVNDLVLFRMVHVSKGSWQAEFRVFQ